MYFFTLFYFFVVCSVPFSIEIVGMANFKSLQSFTAQLIESSFQFRIYWMQGEWDDLHRFIFFARLDCEIVWNKIGHHNEDVLRIHESKNNRKWNIACCGICMHGFRGNGTIQAPFIFVVYTLSERYLFSSYVFVISCVSPDCALVYCIVFKINWRKIYGTLCVHGLILKRRERTEGDFPTSQSAFKMAVGIKNKTMFFIVQRVDWLCGNFGIYHLKLIICNDAHHKNSWQWMTMLKIFNFEFMEKWLKVTMKKITEMVQFTDIQIPRQMHRAVWWHICRKFRSFEMWNAMLFGPCLPAGWYYGAHASRWLKKQTECFIRVSKAAHDGHKMFVAHTFWP